MQSSVSKLKVQSGIHIHSGIQHKAKQLFRICFLIWITPNIDAVPLNYKLTDVLRTNKTSSATPMINSTKYSRKPKNKQIDSVIKPLYLYTGVWYTYLPQKYFKIKIILLYVLNLPSLLSFTRALVTVKKPNFGTTSSPLLKKSIIPTMPNT